MPPIPRPFPRFVADSPQEGLAYGRFEEKLRDAFVAACGEYVAEAGEVDLDTLRWFPDRTWQTRVYVPVIARSSQPDDDGVKPEYFGHVSFVRTDEGELADIRTFADYTAVTAEENPGWRIDLNDDVVGQWRSESSRGGDVTLIWGLPMVRGALAATVELDGETIDQTAVTSGRFTLLAVDNVHGFGGDDLYLDVCIWDRRLRELGRESLYDVVPGDEDEESEEPAGPQDASEGQEASVAETD